jgi:hypothetical protein
MTNVATLPPLYCAHCERHEQPNDEWRALWIDGSRNLIVSRPWEALMRDYLQVAYACGQGAALVLVERYLSTGELSRSTRPAAEPVDRV